VLIPVVLVITHLGGVFFTLFVVVMAVLASDEFMRMLARSGHRPPRLLGVLGSACVCASFYIGGGQHTLLVLTVVVLVLLLERLIRDKLETYLINTGGAVLAIIYIGWLLGHFVLLRNPDQILPGVEASVRSQIGRHLVYTALVLTWSYDTMAYIGGTFWGRHKMFTRVSPAKTAEGMLCGLAACVGAAVVSSSTYAHFLSTGHAVLIGVVISVAAQAGDLVESIMKRGSGVKDSSHLIPGHGGVLDRFDSLLFTGPVLYIYVRLVLYGAT
jgi:phosphatidate cytidylyltransferase